MGNQFKKIIVVAAFVLTGCAGVDPGPTSPHGTPISYDRIVYVHGVLGRGTAFPKSYVIPAIGIKGDRFYDLSLESGVEEIVRQNLNADEGSLQFERNVCSDVPVLMNHQDWNIWGVSNIGAVPPPSILSYPSSGWKDIDDLDAYLKSKIGEENIQVQEVAQFDADENHRDVLVIVGRGENNSLLLVGDRFALKSGFPIYEKWIEDNIPTVSVMDLNDDEGAEIILELNGPGEGLRKTPSLEILVYRGSIMESVFSRDSWNCRD